MTPREKIHFAVDYVARQFQMTEVQLIDGRGDCEPVPAVRHMAFWVAHQIMPHVPLKVLARELQRDRSTIKSGLGKVRSRLARSRWWREAAHRILDEVKAHIELGDGRVYRLGSASGPQHPWARSGYGLASTADEAQKERTRETC